MAQRLAVHCSCHPAIGVDVILTPHSVNLNGINRRFVESKSLERSSSSRTPRVSPSLHLQAQDDESIITSAPNIAHLHIPGESEYILDEQKWRFIERWR